MNDSPHISHGREIELEDRNIKSNSKGSRSSASSSRSSQSRHSDPGPFNPYAGNIKGASSRRSSIQEVLIQDTATVFNVLKKRSIPYIDVLQELVDEAHPSEYSIFHKDVEDAIKEESPQIQLWLQSNKGLLFQLGLCGGFVLILCYDTIFKKISVEAVKNGSAQRVDNMSFVVALGFVSVIIGASMACRSGDLHVLFQYKTLVLFVRYIPVGCVFAGTSYLTFMILQLIDGDTFKVLLQVRLLGVAIVSRIFLGTRQSRTAWTCLVLTLVSALGYFQTKDLAAHEFMFEGLLRSQCSLIRRDGYSSISNVLMDGDDGKTLAMLKTVFDARAACTLDQGHSTSWAYLLDQEAHPDHSQTKNSGRWRGRIYTLVYVVVDSFNAVYEQRLLQADRGMPYSIQMVLKNFWLMTFALMAKVALGARFAKPGDADMFKDGFFAGWNNVWAILILFIMLAKEWFQGLVVKNLDCLVRQLCGVLGIALLYFLLKWHGLIHDPLSLPVIFVNFSVTLSVVGYAFAQVSAKRFSALEKQMAELKGDVNS